MYDTRSHKVKLRPAAHPTLYGGGPMFMIPVRQPPGQEERCRMQP